MLAIAGGILLALFIGLVLIGLARMLRDVARFTYRNLGFCAVALGLTAYGVLAYGSFLFR